MFFFADQEVVAKHAVAKADAATKDAENTERIAKEVAKRAFDIFNLAIAQKTDAKNAAAIADAATKVGPCNDLNSSDSDSSSSVTESAGSEDNKKRQKAHMFYYPKGPSIG